MSTGVHIYIVRTDGDDVIIAATSMMEALDVGYRKKYLDDCEQCPEEAGRDYGAQVLDVGALETMSGSALALLLGDSQ